MDKVTQSDGKDTEQQETGPSLPTVDLPKGGGAIRGIGEKFSANPVTGTSSMSVPIATSPGRAGFGPDLSLTYDSGAGNGPFGMGWNLPLATITRKTDRGLPEYQDAGDSDVFLLAGAEDLVPEYEKNLNGEWVPDTGGEFTAHERNRTVDGRVYSVRRYRPRIEGLFARIERWTNLDDATDVFWRSISKENITTWYGKTDASRIFDPADKSRIFSWLVCESHDDKGNVMVYEYKEENSEEVDFSQAHERNRTSATRACNRYLKRICYGNRKPWFAKLSPTEPWPSAPAGGEWMFEVVFDYGEHHLETPEPNDQGLWDARKDAFSSYRAGFELRSYRLCRRVLMFHHFGGESAVGADCLVRSTDFDYSHEEFAAGARKPVYSRLASVTQSGYRRNNGAYLKRSLPSVDFVYTEPTVQDTVEEVAPESMKNLPVGVDGASYQWTDLHGEGIPGILTEQGGTWFYKRNLSPLDEGPAKGTGKAAVKFAPLERVGTKPNVALAEGAQFMDLAGDGQPDLVVMGGPTPGRFKHDGREGWRSFRPFTSRLNRDMGDPNLKFLDLDGDGHADVLISEDDAFIWHRSLAEEGFGPAKRVVQALDEEKGPRLVFADGTQSIYLADMSGDGLTDIVRIRNGGICYWPNLGYGRFGAKVAMDRAPHFDNPDQFNHQRIRLADIDGTGLNDLIYLHRDGVRLYFNQSGNGWSGPQALHIFPRVDDLASITPADLLGNGTACLVWSSPLPGDASRPMRYVNLMGAHKPHLLVAIKNNLGAETRIHYAPSTKFYLQDKAAGTPWVTRLPFPVHVVERVESYDHISRNRFVSRYAYHHGYFDGEEREFRGFGMVEQWDTEQIGSLSGDHPLPEASNVAAAFDVPPVHTKTWFHTGIYLNRDQVSRQFQHEYYREPGLSDDQARAQLLPDTTLPVGLTLHEEREACRALKGMMLRQEIYADDASAGSPEALIQRAATPYTVVEQDFTIRPLQPLGGNPHAVFFTHPREAVTYHYERNPVDPRVQHALTLKVDDFGNVLQEVAIGYGRRQPDLTLPTEEDRKNQSRNLIVYTENRVTNPIDDSHTHPHDYRAPLPAESRTYEMTGFEPASVGSLFSFEEWAEGGSAWPELAMDIPSEEAADYNAMQKRLIEHARTLYRQDDLTALLPLGELDPLALPGESYQLAFTPGLLAQVFKRKQSEQPEEDLLPNPAALLEGKGVDQGGYVAIDGGWWAPSGRSFFAHAANLADPAATAAAERDAARQHFYLPRKIADPFGHSAVVDYDPYNLLVVRTRDALDNTVAAENDYRVLQPQAVTDPNGNRTAAAFDVLGMVTATAVMGKEGENLGDLLEDFDADPPLADLQAFIADPRAQSASLLGKASTRVVCDLGRYARAGQPPCAATLAREPHFHDDSGGTHTRIQVSFSYSDGFEREIQTKVQAEAGEAPQRQADLSLPTGDIHPGDLVHNADGMVAQDNSQYRWVGTGRTVFNNKGNPVRQYEPFFSATHLYEPEGEMTDTGVSPVLFYDPIERVIATLHPNHTYDKVVFDSWQQTTWDVNDTVVSDPRADEDIKGYLGEYFQSLPATWQTWWEQRQGDALSAPEQASASKAAAHADTPATAYLDTLGRAFLTVAHNRFRHKDSDGTIETVEEKYATRLVLDVEGHERAVTDAKDRIVMRYNYDLLGNRMHQASMEAGERWMLNDVVGNPIRSWDSRRFVRRMTYDALRRPTKLFVTEKGAERLSVRTDYGEAEGSAKNHRTQVHKLFDEAGVVTSLAYDFKGNLLESRRDLLPTYKQAVNWSENLAANDGSFTTRSAYDALNRPLTVTTPDGSIYRPTYNEASLLDKVDVNLRAEQAIGQPTWTPFVTNIDYDAKGQRQLIAYANGARTTYEYDENTFRLTHLKTTRPSSSNGVSSQLFTDSAIVQDLHYTYDPAGNITRIEDAALQTISHNNERVKPVCSYTYDAVYRLIEARGREHIGQAAHEPTPLSGNQRDAPFFGLSAHSNDLQAMRAYAQRYAYDQVGNFQTMVHAANGGSWTRRYEYQQNSLIESDKNNNRLTKTILGNGTNSEQTYSYADDQGNDVHGCITAINTMKLAWDSEDRLQQVSLVDGGTAYYVYDASGERVRKVIETTSGARQKECLYLGGFEIFRAYSGNNAALLLERETLHVMDDQQRIALIEPKTIEHGSQLSAPTILQRYQLGNHLGSASVELSESGVLITYEEYHPYGTTAFQAGRTAAETKLKRYRYTGMERDEETGLAYHSARYYLPWLGRWCSADPIGIGDGVNLYGYVRNRATTSSDRNGKQMYQHLGSGGTSGRNDGENDFREECAYDAVEDLEHSIVRFNELFHEFQEDLNELYEMHSSLRESFDQSVDKVLQVANSSQSNRHLVHAVGVMNIIANQLVELESDIDNLSASIEMAGQRIMMILDNNPDAFKSLVDRMENNIAIDNALHQGAVLSELTTQVMERSISQQEYYERVYRKIQVGRAIASSPTAAITAITMSATNPNADFGDQRYHARITGSAGLMAFSRNRVTRPLPHSGLQNINVPPSDYRQIGSQGPSRGGAIDRQHRIEIIGKSGRPEGWRTTSP